MKKRLTRSEIVFLKSKSSLKPKINPHLSARIPNKKWKIGYVQEN